MANIKIHVFHTGEVCVSPNLPSGGENCNPINASGFFDKKSNRLWLPVSAYLIEHPKGKFVLLFSDGGYARKSWEEMILSGIAADSIMVPEIQTTVEKKSVNMV